MQGWGLGACRAIAPLLHDAFNFLAFYPIRPFINASDIAGGDEGRGFHK